MEHKLIGFVATEEESQCWGIKLCLLNDVINIVSWFCQRRMVFSWVTYEFDVS